MNSRQTSPRSVISAYAQGATYNSPEHEAIIASSRERSRAYGLDNVDAPDFSGTSRTNLTALLEENHFLFQHAAPVMETLYEQIVNTQSMVLLTTRSGTILHSLGDTDFLEKAAQVALAPGVDWSEKSKGTNAIGTALSEGQALVVHGNQHFLHFNHFLTCSCTPILDPHGDVIGALDVTGDYRSYHQHTMALTRMSAQMIENHMFADVFPTEVRIHFHARPEFIGTIVEGIAVFTTDGRFLSANRSAQFQFGMSINALRAHTFSSLFGTGISQFFDKARSANGQSFNLCLHDGVSVCCKSDLKFNSATNHLSRMSAEANSTPPVYKKRKDEKIPLSSLRYLDTGDPQVSAVVKKLRIIQDRDIPIMILGETGTGKDLLAQAIHNDSKRGAKNFVSLNCASIPESLIESELFGYEEGAFTGAKRKGSTGKILFANEGTLFLDEIGDMPLHLQARLLRVLQERKVNPLGSGREVEVDITIICATNKNLKDMIANGTFREDLYYRLNGLVVQLPALRDRTDLDVVTQKILGNVCSAEKRVGVSHDVMQLFRRYKWPGNFRQLFNLLRTAVVMAECEGDIQIHHLPDDFLSDVQQINSAPSPQVVRHAMPEVSQAEASPADLYDPQTLNLENVAIDAIAQALRTCKGNVSAAAKMLGVSRNTIYRKKHLLPNDL
ncbi:sigma-54-dependent Fis family transcriptional regulator [Limnohabitans sp. TS-CS-82]|uniref:sigma-54-dependent Fis family transcriptional regulator n=1 Tax=Limnohabitans sp. TS-CS-82 TaxID=2094193 RepID=UPI000CF2CF7A|nr:sigma-54-dependent Fis family transcriptional regulator [Limnohabitans sp. TS-CS-82]PQA83704.1 sigma-54-dependent Fis family transcriptional regulator [Limnohabitans sp. TS-CS-82]